jgi:tetratricopeptide (TPR) repeat protein
VGAYPEGQAAFRQAVTLDPANVDAWSGLIDATYNVDGLQAAYDTASEATAANPSDAQILVRLGDLAWELGDPEGAEGAYRPAMELDPAFIPAYLALANLLEDQGRPEVAAAALELGIERNPQDPWLHEALGQNLIERGEAEAAFQHFNAAFDIDPSYGWFGVQAASAGYQHNGDVDSTAELLERSAAAMPEDADLLDAVGQVYEAMGDCGLASAYYRRALDINPQLENPQAGLTRCGG